MKIQWIFDDKKTISELEVDDDIGIVIIDSRRAEHNLEEKERYHCPYSYDAIEYEGLEYADKTRPDEEIIKSEEKERIEKAFSHLTEVQQRRLLMLADGLSIREIARLEKVDHRAVRESIEASRKKFLKNF